MSMVPPVRSAGYQVDSSIGSLTSLAGKDLWRSATPAPVRSAWSRGAHADAWAIWADHLTSRAEADQPRKGVPPILWGLPPAQAEAIGEWLAEGPDAKGRAAVNAAQRWVATATGREADPVFALECVAWARRLARLAPRLGSDAWWSLAEALGGIAQEASSAPAAEVGMTDEAVVHQLLAGELPLTLATRLPELRPFAALGDSGRGSLSEGLEALTDGEGLLPAAMWTDGPAPAAPILLACWTRCVALGGGAKPWNANAQGHYEWLVRQSLRLVDRHGRFAFAAEPACGATAMMSAALSRGGDAADRAAAAERLKAYEADRSFETPEPSNHSDWAELGVLAGGWRDKSPRIIVAHPSDSLRIEVQAGRRVLLEGLWPVDASIDGAPLAASDDWECQCWHADDDADYLELALPLSGGARLERQFFLARQDGVGFIAETLFTGRETPAAVELTTALEFGPGVTLRPENQTRDATLVAAGEEVAGLLPLALPEWRDEPRGGELAADAGRLRLSRRIVGVNVASFLWIDFAPSRFAKQRTWRQLTIAESLERVSPDVAIGYRVQSGKGQWFVYRSLGPRGNRTLLGQNLSSEMLVGRFNAPEGTVSEYFEVQGPDDDE